MRDSADQQITRILIADDHCLFRKGIIMSLSAGFPTAQFMEAGNAAEIFRIIGNGRWDLVILDINMPGRDGLDVLKDIKANYPEIPVIIFSMYSEDQFALRTIRAGAVAYLRKDLPAADFSDAIRRVLNGERYLTPPLIELIANEIREDHKKSSHEDLSDREFQVFLLIASGLNVTQISNKLGLSVKTISVYRSNILKKMALKNNSEITHYAFKHNLVE